MEHLWMLYASFVRKRMIHKSDWGLQRSMSHVALSQCEDAVSDRKWASLEYLTACV